MPLQLETDIVVLIKIKTKIEYNKIKSTRNYFERPTYYGAYYSQTKEFIVQELKKRTAIASENFPRDQKYYLLPEKSQFKKRKFHQETIVLYTAIDLVIRSSTWAKPPH